MAVRIHYTPAALEDIDAIERFIEQDSPASAARFVEEIYRHSRSLADFPLIGAPWPELGDGVRLLGMRRRVDIVYRPEPGQVTIVRVLYGGRDPVLAMAEDQ